MPPFNRLLSLMTKPWFLIFYVLFTALAFIYVDKPLAEYFDAVNLRTNFELLNWFTKLGLGFIYLLGFFAGALFFRFGYVNRIWEVRCWFLWLSVAFTGGICVVLKTFFGRARPEMWFENQCYGFYGLQTKATFWSFPSGHTSIIMAVAYGLCIFFPRQSMIYIVVGFLVALSRVLLVHHYLTDVLTAAYLTLLEIGFLLWASQKTSWFNVALANNKQPGLAVNQ